MRALLPRADAVLLDATLDAVTASARATGDNRTPAQLRADTLTAMTLHTLRTTHHTTTTTPTPATTPTRTTAAATTTTTTAAGAAADGKNTGSTGNAGDTGPGTTDTTEVAEVADPAGTAEVAEVAEVAGPADPEGPEDLSAPAGLAGPVGAVGFTGLEGPAPDPAGGADPAYIDEMGLTPDGVPLEGLLTALSGLVCHTSPWWTPSGTDPIPLPPGLTVSIDVTVPLNHLTDLLPDDTTPEDDPPTTTPTTGPGAGTGAPGPGTGAPAAGPAAGPGGPAGRTAPLADWLTVPVWARWVVAVGVVIPLVTGIATASKLPLWTMSRRESVLHSSRWDAAQQVIDTIPEGASVETDLTLLAYLVPKAEVSWVGTSDTAKDYVVIDSHSTAWGGRPPQNAAQWATQSRHAAYNLVLDVDGFQVAERVG